jgi:hypothetical protein
MSWSWLVQRLRNSTRASCRIAWLGFVAASVVLGLGACDCENQAFPPDQSSRVSIAGGAWGRVWLWGPEPTPSANECELQQEIAPVSRTLLFFEPINPDDAVGASLSDPEGGVFGVYYDEVLSNVVDSVTSDDTGFFEVSLDPGQYSLLIRAGDALFWPEGFLGAEEINLIEVPNQGVAELMIDIHSLLPL